MTQTPSDDKSVRGAFKHICPHSQAVSSLYVLDSSFMHVSQCLCLVSLPLCALTFWCDCHWFLVAGILYFARGELLRSWLRACALPRWVYSHRRGICTYKAARKSACSPAWPIHAQWLRPAMLSGQVLANPAPDRVGLPTRVLYRLKTRLGPRPGRGQPGPRPG